MCVRPGPKNPAASTCAREGSNRERASRLSYSVGGALHGAQKGLGSFFNRGRRHGEGSRWRHQGFEDNAGALSRFLSAQQPSHKLKCRARTKKSKTAEAAGTRLRSHSFWALGVGKTSQAEAHTHDDDDDKNHTRCAGASAGTCIISFGPLCGTWERSEFFFISPRANRPFCHKSKILWPKKIAF